MSIDVNPNWWKYIFDHVYLQTDSRSVCNEDLTRKEIDIIHDYLPECHDLPILDLCGGQGRHAIELSKRGYKSLTVYDYSIFLLKQGIKQALRSQDSPWFIQGDARQLCFKNNTYAAAMILGSAFGYFIQDRENQKLLLEACRVLIPGGRLIMDIPNRDYVIHHFKPFITHRNGSITINRKRSIQEDVIYSQETVVCDQKGCIRDQTFCTRLYSKNKIKDLLLKTGFASVTFNENYITREKKGDYGSMTNRLMIQAEKGHYRK